jgi:hypothetical protein
MEQTATSSLIREEEGALLVEPFTHSAETRPFREPAPIAGDEQRPLSPLIVREARIVFLLAFGGYFTVAWLLDFKYKIFPADAFSRMANGFYVLYSRDPHLAAVGFVWEPLQSMADTVFLLGNHLWPALSQDEMAGCLVSALAMAGAVYQMCSALREWGVSRTPRLVLTAFFALDPMILYYGGNGMSEALYLFLLIASTRYLLRWMRDGDLRSLAYSAVALGFCYLTRNEAALAALLGGFAVGVVSYGRAEGRRLSRLRTGASDLMIFGVPAFVAALGWALCSYVIIGQLLDGGALSVRLANQRLGHSTLGHRVLYEVHAIGALAPFLPILLVVATFVAFKRRDLRILAPVVVLGGALGFDMLSYLSNSIDSALRYWIAVIPLAILLLGSLVAAVQTPRPTRDTAPMRTRSSRAGVPGLGVLAAVCLVMVVMIPTVVFTGAGMLNPRVGVEESQQIGFVFKPHDKNSQNSEVYPFAQTVNRYLERLHLPDGDVLVDNADAAGCVPQTVVTSDQPKLFVIPNDRDFQRILADPIAFNTRYLLVPDPATDEPGAVNHLYPSLWTTGAGFTKMVHKFRAQSACPDYRLFYVLHHSNSLT